MRIDHLANHPAHLVELARLHFDEWSYLRPGESLGERIGRLRRTSGRNDIPSVVVALKDAELLGSAMLLANDMDSRPQLTPWLGGVFVKPACRGRGIGSALVRHIQAQATAVTMPSALSQSETQEHWYGWQTLSTDAAWIGLLGISLLTQRCWPVKGSLRTERRGDAHQPFH